MNLLPNRSIKTKLSLMLLLPLLGLLYFSGAAVMEKFRAVDNLHALQSLVRLAVKNSAAIHEIQKERGLSAGFIGSRGEKFAAELADQRTATDRKLAELQAFLGDFDAAPFGADFRSALGATQSHLDKLGDMRQAVSALQVGAKDSFGYYTGLVDSLLDVTVAITKVSKDDEIARSTVSYFMFLNGKERMGQERATLNGVFAADRFEPESLQRFIALVAAEDTYFKLFATYAGGNAVAFFREKTAGGSNAEVDALRKTALDKMAEGHFGVEPANWFKAISGKINAMKEVEDRLSGGLDSLAAEKVSEARRKMWLGTGFTAAAVLLTLLISYFVATGILHPMKNLHTTMMRLQESDDLTLRCRVEGRDEVGQMAGAFNGMIASFQDIIGVIHANAEQVATAAIQLAAATEQVTQGSNSQSEAASACAAAIEQMTASASTVAESAQEVSQLSKDTLIRSQEGNQSLSQLFGAIDVAESTVGSIAGVVKEFISDAVHISKLTQEVRDIAEQTNLLALNAAIEAARAGDQGRGFAVVADEVRKLAEKSAHSANEIDIVTRAVAQHSEAVEAAVTEGVGSLRVSQDSMENVAMVMSDATESVGHTTDGIDNITAAVREQNATIGDIAHSVEEIAHMAEENGFAVASVASATHSLQDLAVGLQQTVGKFQY